jgi:hypothetical protein
MIPASGIEDSGEQFCTDGDWTKSYPDCGCLRVPIVG